MRAIRFDEGLLDDAERIEGADQAGTLRAIATAGAQIRQAATLAVEAGVAGLRDDGRPRTLVVVASGADEAVGGIVTAVAGPDTAVPVVVVADGVLPGWVGPLDLVVACDAAGERVPADGGHDTVALVAAAGRRGCRLVVVSPRRTPLAEAAAAARALHVPIEPAGRPPGTNLWLLAAPALLAAAASRVIAVAPAFDDVADLLDDLATRCRPSQEPFVNPAKELALGLAGDLPLLWATGPLAAVAARRLAARLAAQAGCPALPAAAHEVVGAALGLLDGPLVATGSDDIFFDPEVDSPSSGTTRPHVVLLHDGITPDGTTDGPAREGAFVADRVEVLRGVIERRGVRLRELVGEGREPLARLASLVCLGDFAAAYLALALGREPAAAAALLEFHEPPADGAESGE